jgi:hypothetical protein
MASSWGSGMAQGKSRRNLQVAGLLIDRAAHSGIDTCRYT